jgi:hypothetical protein
MIYLAFAFASGAMLGALFGWRLGARRGADRIVDEMIAADLEAPDYFERCWPRARREARPQ